MSSLLSDCTNGLVGALYANIDDRDDDNEEASDRNVSFLYDGAILSN
jgi:hypothetical protein